MTRDERENAFEKAGQRYELLLRLHDAEINNGPTERLKMLEEALGLACRSVCYFAERQDRTHSMAEDDIYGVMKAARIAKE